MRDFFAFLRRNRNVIPEDKMVIERKSMDSPLTIKVPPRSLVVGLHTDQTKKRATVQLINPQSGAWGDTLLTLSKKGTLWKNVAIKSGQGIRTDQFGMMKEKIG